MLITVLAVAVLVIVNLNRFIGERQRTYHLVGIVPGVDGIQPGTPVLLAGHQVGEVVLVQVHPVTADPLARFSLHLELDQAAQPHVRTDSELHLVRPRLLGLPAVQIEPGSAGMPQLQDGDTLRMATRLQMQRVIARAEAAKDAAAALSDQAAILLDQLPAPDTAALRQLAREIDAARSEFHSLGIALRDGPIAHFQRQRLEATLDGLRATLAELQTAWDRYAALFDQPPPHLAELRLQIDRVEATLREGRGILWRWPRDRAIHRSLDELRVQLDSLMAEARRNPLMFFF